MMQFEQEWINGGVSLGAAAGWTADEIRLVSELGYALAEQGRNPEAITIFEGLVALAPATAYFETALGALWLRENEPARALPHLNAAIAADSSDITARVNRGEVFLLLRKFRRLARRFKVCSKSANTAGKTKSLYSMQNPRPRTFNGGRKIFRRKKLNF